MNSSHHLIESQPTEVELKNIFAASCVESLASRLNCSTSDMYKRMKKANIFNEYIYPFYDTLHTESRENVTDDILQCLLKWEGQA